mgnify:CR=1 FL=1
MNRKFATNLVFVLLLNFLVKPFYILGIDAEIQNRVGAEEYGLYFSLLGFTFLFNILLDVGIINYNTRTISQQPFLIEKYFSKIASLRILLAVIYATFVLILGTIIGYNQAEIYLLLWLVLNQILASFTLYFRSNLAGLLLFKYDSIVSVLDKFLLIILCSILLWGGITEEPFQLFWFVYAQTFAYLVSGITAFVLKYRLPTSKSIITVHEAPLQDAQRAMRWVRAHAPDYGVNPNKIGVIGFSAGGHVASTLGTQYDRSNTFKEQPLDSISARPDFMALIYPVITMKQDFAHQGSRDRLLGKTPSQALVNKYSNELHVTKNTPSTFLVHSSDDHAVPVENSINFYSALKREGVDAELHIYPYGKHGYSLAINKGRLQTWTDRLEDWLSSF